MATSSRELYETLLAKRAAIVKAIAPLYKKRDDLKAKIAALEVEERKASDAVKKAQAEAGLFELDKELGGLAKALGGRSMPAGR